MLAHSREIFRFALFSLRRQLIVNSSVPMIEGEHIEIDRREKRTKEAI